MPEKLPSKFVGFRAPARMMRLIDYARGEASVSSWVRDACAQRIEGERGIGPEFGARLADHNAQLRALGGNVNQLARAANENRPVVVDRKLLDDIKDAIRESRALLIELHKRLPE